MMDAIAKTGTLVQPKPFDTFTMPDFSGKTDFKEVVNDLTTYFTKQNKKFSSMLYFSGALTARIQHTYYFTNLLRERANTNLSPDQLAKPQAVRNTCVNYVEFLLKQCKTIDALVSALFQTQKFLAETIKETGAVKEKTWGTQSVIQAATENHESAKALKTKIDDIWLSASAVQATLHDRTSSAHQKIDQLITCLDTNGGGAISMGQIAARALLGGGKLTIHESKSPVGPSAAGALAHTDEGSEKKKDRSPSASASPSASPSPSASAWAVAAAPATVVVATVPPKA